MGPYAAAGAATADDEDMVEGGGHTYLISLLIVLHDIHSEGKEGNLKSRLGCATIKISVSFVDVIRGWPPRPPRKHEKKSTSCS